MAYDFFFSYPSLAMRLEDYLRKFYVDIGKEIGIARGKPPDEVGMIDEKGLLHGTNWRESLPKAMNECRCIVAICTPAYYRSETCMREFDFFAARVRNVKRKHPVLKPVLWNNGREPQPKRIAELQYTVGEKTSPVNIEGVRDALRNGRRKAYLEYVKKLADEIMATAEEQPELPPGTSNFDSPAQASVDVIGPGHVHLLYIAQSDEGARGWRPFLPAEQHTIGHLAEDIAEGKGFSTNEIKAANRDDVLAALAEADRRKNLVVVLVDGKSVQVREHEELLRAIGGTDVHNLSVLVPWNRRDAELMNAQSTLQKQVRNAVGDRAKAGQPLFFNDAILDLADLSAVLGDTLTRLRAHIFAEGSSRTTPSVPLPALSNMGTAA